MIMSETEMAVFIRERGYRYCHRMKGYAIIYGCLISDDRSGFAEENLFILSYGQKLF